jgi:hypothetical protein
MLLTSDAPAGHIGGLKYEDLHEVGWGRDIANLWSGALVARPPRIFIDAPNNCSGEHDHQANHQPQRHRAAGSARPAYERDCRAAFGHFAAAGRGPERARLPDRQAGRVCAISCRQSQSAGAKQVGTYGHPHRSGKKFDVKHAFC